MSTTLTVDTVGVPTAPTSDTDARPWGLIRHSVTLAGRSILKIKRSPEQLIDVTLQPIIFTVLFVYLFGGAIAGTQHEYLQFVLPALMVQTVLFASLSIGVNLNTDIQKGVFDRFRSLPIPRSAPLVGAVLGDIVRFVTSIVVLMGFGYAIGFRVQTDPAQAFLACLLVLAFALSLSWIAVLIGMLVREPGTVQGIGFLLMFPLTFGSSMFVPVNTMPGWLQAWVKVNPVTHLVEASRGLMLGGDVAWPVTQSLLWSIGITVVFAPLAVRAYRSRT
ncbi:MAG TPA: ABC transporter permease [Kineosporiaceae bacterium]|nr:ABC transporter permease [Kineosporiaceae bacterium]